MSPDTLPQKQRWPLAQAEAVALAVVEKLAPFCDRIQIAGSIRRRKEAVGDIEIVFIPRQIQGSDFFALEPATDSALADLIAAGWMEKRPNKIGATAWGASNKLARHVESGIPVDLFATSPACWFNYLVCRTGGAISNTEIASRAKALGWKWNNTGEGFSRRTGPDRGRVVRMDSEEAVFSFVRLPYPPPEARR